MCWKIFILFEIIFLYCLIFLIDKENANFEFKVFFKGVFLSWHLFWRKKESWPDLWRRNSVLNYIFISIDSLCQKSREIELLSIEELRIFPKILRRFLREKWKFEFLRNWNPRDFLEFRVCFRYSDWKFFSSKILEKKIFLLISKKNFFSLFQNQGFVASGFCEFFLKILPKFFFEEFLWFQSLFFISFYQIKSSKKKSYVRVGIY